MPLELPDFELPLTEAEARWIGFEPPYFFPSNQNSYYGELRRTVTNQMQFIIDLLDLIYVNLDPDTATAAFIADWERALGIPVNRDVSLEVRRETVKTHFLKGAFRRHTRNLLIWRYILATYGETVRLTPDGVELTVDGIPLRDEPVIDEGTAPMFPLEGIPITAGGIVLTGEPIFNVIEDVGIYYYEVRISTSVTPDIPSMTRDLEWMNFAPLTFDVTVTDDMWP